VLKGEENTIILAIRLESPISAVIYRDGVDNVFGIICMIALLKWIHWNIVDDLIIEPK